MCANWYDGVQRAVVVAIGTDRGPVVVQTALSDLDVVQPGAENASGVTSRELLADLQVVLDQLRRGNQYGRSRRLADIRQQIGCAAVLCGPAVLRPDAHVPQRADPVDQTLVRRVRVVLVVIASSVTGRNTSARS